MVNTVSLTTSSSHITSSLFARSTMPVITSISSRFLRFWFRVAAYAASSDAYDAGGCTARLCAFRPVYVMNTASVPLSEHSAHAYPSLDPMVRMAPACLFLPNK